MFMGLSVFYDPCSSCEHKDTKSLCNLCILTYLRNCYKNDFVEEEKDEQTACQVEQPFRKDN